ncbi:MAG TPA: LysE family transporter [Saprospiraceae bacterium]|nr:LysE family transporter [Saprospiraceae bacterium]HQW24379.1 LysE family transporter [Saprospiraceae bacterium]
MSNLLSIVLFGEGFATGMMLTIMLGPVTMIILRYGLQVNRLAGLWAAAGTWVSDFVFIGLTYWMTTTIDSWSQQPGIRLAMFLVGGFGLLVMGGLMLRVRKKSFSAEGDVVQASYIQAFVGGFLVNSLSPFTLFFWLGAAVFLHLQSDNPIWYYAGLMLALAAGDFTKAWLAPKLSSWLKESHVYWIQIVAGVLIACTGLYVMIVGLIES